MTTVEKNNALLPTEDLIIALFCRVDDALEAQGLNGKHAQANLTPSEVVTLAMLFSLKGTGQRAFYRWLLRDWLKLFPALPDRTRLFRLFNSHAGLTEAFLAEPSMIGVIIDTYGIELIHPRREGRSERQIGRKGISNQRWIVGGKLCFLLNHFGQVVAWDCSTANAYDGSTFQRIALGRLKVRRWSSLAPASRRRTGIRSTSVCASVGSGTCACWSRRSCRC